MACKAQAAPCLTPRCAACSAEAVAEANSTAFLLIDVATPRWKILFCNTAFTELTELELDGVRGVPLWDLFVTEVSVLQCGLEQCRILSSQEPALCVQYVLNSSECCGDIAGLVPGSFRAGTREQHSWAHSSSRVPAPGLKTVWLPDGSSCGCKAMPPDTKMLCMQLSIRASIALQTKCAEDSQRRAALAPDRQQADSCTAGQPEAIMPVMHSVHLTASPSGEQRAHDGSSV